MSEFLKINSAYHSINEILRARDVTWRYSVGLGCISSLFQAPAPKIIIIKVTNRQMNYNEQDRKRETFILYFIL